MRRPSLIVRMPLAAAAASLIVAMPAAAASAPAGATAHSLAAKKKKKRPAPLRPNLALTGATVFAAASLTEAFSAMAPRLTYSFAGSDQLAFQIRQGAPADVFASASLKYPDDLAKAGLVQNPEWFAYNTLVVIVPKKNPAKITSVFDLAKPGVKLVIGDATVPVGSYTRTVLKRLKLDAALNNVVSNEPDVKGVVQKVALGEADAGVAYFTDFRADQKHLNHIAIPAESLPTVAYSIAITSNAKNPATARKFISYLHSTDGRRWLKHYGFQLG